MLKRWAAAIALLFAIPMAITGAGTGQAGVTDDVDVATTCYGGSESFDILSERESGQYTASHRCNDINVRMDANSANSHISVCFYPTSGDPWCNTGEFVRGTGWHVVATDVLPGTTFTLFNHNIQSNVMGQVAS